ncbi:hypothetical protein H2200_003137 [Cladophialophora chaetospira]|uniref:BZIP domain-containing protein n=1 Tax=Cladophialophora chaetospira TaxID=386627 RepID=A0AA38XH02_9EURO|nr:hypothetical protein H2200_003137 [Cladophialophora chaetospira]
MNVWPESQDDCGIWENLSSPWPAQYSSGLSRNSLSSSRHKNYFQWPVWESPVYQNYPRYNPLAYVNHGQRNFQTYNNGHLVGDYQQYASLVGQQDVDPFEGINHNVYVPDTIQGLEAVTDSMEEEWFQPPAGSAPGEEPAEVLDGLIFSFSENFFANPFAVSFPGDLPCPTGSTPAPSGYGSPKDFSAGEKTMAAIPAATTPIVQKKGPINSIATPVSTVSTPSSSGGVSKPKDKTSAPSTYGPQIHFVDMADKKGAQRIRNTMNSRKHRQNKLDKIRELEKQLAELQAQKDKWQQRASIGG